MSSQNNLYILIVEDDDVIARMYEFKLNLEGFSVRLASNGLHALKIIKEARPDLILLDLRMPVMDGEEFLERFRILDDSTPVVVLTNISKDEAPKTIWHFGISGYYVKAQNKPSDLVNIIENILRN